MVNLTGGHSVALDEAVPQAVPRCTRTASPCSLNLPGPMVCRLGVPPHFRPSSWKLPTEPGPRG